LLPSPSPPHSPPDVYPLSLHDALPILRIACACAHCVDENTGKRVLDPARIPLDLGIRSFGTVGRYALSIAFSDNHDTGIYPYKRSEEHTSELQSLRHLVCRLLLEKKKH